MEDVIVWASIGTSLQQGQFELIDLPFICCWGYYEHGSSDDNLGFGEPIHMKDWVGVHIAERKKSGESGEKKKEGKCLCEYNQTVMNCSTMIQQGPKRRRVRS